MKDRDSQHLTETRNTGQEGIYEVVYCYSLQFCLDTRNRIVVASKICVNCASEYLAGKVHVKTMGSIRNSLFMFQEVRDIALSVARALASTCMINSSSLKGWSKCKSPVLTYK